MFDWLLFVSYNIGEVDMMNKIHGIHHATLMTSDAIMIYEFFTYTLGMRLVKKTVNQDDINTYHLFFADEAGNAGTDVTFFDFQGNAKAIKGTNEIAKIGLRVTSNEAIDYWLTRFDYLSVNHHGVMFLFDRKAILFEDFDGQEYILISDEGIKGVRPGIPWHLGPIPDEYAIVGLGPVYFRVSDAKRFDHILDAHLGFKLVKEEHNLYLYEVAPGGNGASVIVEQTSNMTQGRQGDGAIHHVAFRVKNKTDLNSWITYLNSVGYRHSGHVDRFYFHSLYTRMYPNMLFEFATDGPGFLDGDETYETLGEQLALPPRFKDKREWIEKKVRMFDTTRSNKNFVKEYFK